MKPRPLAALGVLLLCAAAWAQGAPAPAKPPVKAAPAAPAAPTGGSGPDVFLRPLAPKSARKLTIDGVPDTGQYLPDSAVIGRVDGRPVITVYEFRKRWYTTHPLDRPKTDSLGRVQMLNSLADKFVLAALAREVNRPFGFEDRLQLKEARQRLLSNAMFARYVADSGRYTMDEVRHLYDQGRNELHLQRIVAGSARELARARADLLAGRITWSAAVRKYSTAAADEKAKDGDQGWVGRSTFDPGPALEIFDLPDGGTSSVFKNAGLWEVVRVVGRRPVRQPSFETMSRILSNEVFTLKIARRSEALRAEVRTRIGMAYDTTNIEWASSLFADHERANQGTPEDPVIDMSGSLPDFQLQDTSRVLARWKDGTYSLGQFLAAFNNIAVPQRGAIGSFNAFRATLDGFVLEPYMAQFALERGLDKDPIVVDGLARIEERIRVEHLYGDSVEARVRVTGADRQRYYREHQPEFYSFQNVTVFAIARHSKAGVDSIEARLKAGETPAQILRADSIAGLNMGSIKVISEDDKTQPYKKQLFEEMKIGGILRRGPDKVGDYMLVQKIAHDHGRQLALSEVVDLVDQNLQNIEAERLLKELIARHRPGHQMELHPELVMRVRLTDPANE